MKLYSPAVIAALKEKYNFKISKSLGQNFLTDQNIIDKIIDGAQIGEGDLVIEIGPGLGALTVAAASRAAKVTAIEIDKNLIPILADALQEYKNIEIIHGDILKQNLNEIIQQNTQKSGRNIENENNIQSIDNIKIIGNLPYYITTPVIMKILEEKTQAHSLTVMMQKEVAERINANPGTKAYGAVTVAINYYCTVRHISDVPRSVFIPKPNVDSQVLRLDIRENPPVRLTCEKVFFSCIKAGFGQRRKTLLNALTGVCGLDKQSVLEALQKASIDPTRRAETLSLDEFATLSNSIRQVIFENSAAV